MANGCDCSGPCQMPEWVVAGWYSNNPDAQARASAHWHHMRRVGWTTPDERAAVREYRERRRDGLHSCAGGCGLAFHKPTTCYWCKQYGFQVIRQALEDYRASHVNSVR